MRIGVLTAATLVLVALAMGRLSVNVAVVFAILGIVSGVVAGGRVEAIEQAVVPQGNVLLVVRVAEEASGTTYSRAVGKPISVAGEQWNGPRIALIGLDPSIPVGATVTVEGELRRHVSRVRDEIVAGVLRIEETLEVHPSTNPIVRVGNVIRGRVISTYDGSRSGDGLVRGLLIGDTGLLSAGDEEDLRRASLLREELF